MLQTIFFLTLYKSQIILSDIQLCSSNSSSMLFLIGSSKISNNGYSSP